MRVKLSRSRAGMVRVGRRLLPLATVPFLMGTCNSTAAPNVRPPTPQERAKIIRAVNETWEYESHPLPAGEQIHLRRPSLRPNVVRIAVARADHRFASAVVELRDADGRRRRSPAVMVFQRIDHDKWNEKEFGAWVVEGPTTVVSHACTPATPRGIRALLCPDPWSVLRYPRPRVRLQTSYTQEIPTTDLHAVDWKKVALPGGVCGSSRPIRPRSVTRWSGQAFIHPDVTLIWWNPVWVYSWEKPVFGDLDGDGSDEAALHVGCANGGGMAAGQLAFSEVIFKAVGESMRVLGVVTPRQPLNAESPHVPLLWTVSIDRGTLIAPEYWYGPYDGTCCPSGEARTTWKYVDGRLRPARTTIVRTTWTSPLRIQDLLVNGRSLEHDRVSRIDVTLGLRIALSVDNQSIPEMTKRDVGVTLTIEQSGSPIVRTKTIERIPAWSAHAPRLIFRDLGPLELGSRTTIQVEIHDPGTNPARYPVIFARS